MPSFPFLTHTTSLYNQHLASWQRDEKRLYGGDWVLDELLQWKGEEDEFYTSRVAQAGYITLPKLHAGTLTGHLSGETPIPNFGSMGEVRRRDELKGNPSFAELLWYNVGIGQDGDELLPWFDGVQERSMATGFRWVLVEMPTLAVLRSIREVNNRDSEGPLTDQDVIDGFRPYPVEYSPTEVPFWQYTNGRLDFAVIRTVHASENVLDENFNVLSTDKGFYLLVRQGFKGLGEPFMGGGWWKFDASGQPIEGGASTWGDKGQRGNTLGQIPMFQFVGERSPGTTDRPAIARSLTMELGQIAVSLMNRISERNWNMMQAAKSVDWIMGIEPKDHAKIVTQQNLGSITIGVPPVILGDGRAAIPTMWNSSAALLDASAFEMVIRSGLEEAREIMIKQVTSAPESSGASKKAGFAEATSPLLRRLAATRQSAMNTFLYFAALRGGFQNPQANVTIPREFRLAPAVDEIEAGLNMLKRSWLRSVTLEKELIVRAMDERGLMPEKKEERQSVIDELEESATVTEPADQLQDDAEDTPGRTGPKPMADGQQAAA